MIYEYERTMICWRSGGWPLGIFYSLEPNYLQCRKMPLQKMGEMAIDMNLKISFRKIYNEIDERAGHLKRVRYWGTSCPLPPCKRAEGVATPPAPQHRHPC